MGNNTYHRGLVSVITPTYRRSEKLPRAIESILNQTYSNLELFVVNDNDPSDEYTEYVKEITAKYSSDPRFHLIIQDKHINGAVARNIAIKQSKGEFIAFLDDDDWWEPTKLDEQVRELNSLDQSWGGVSCKFTLYNQKGDIIGRTQKYEDGYIFRDVLSLYSDVATGTLLLRRSALDKAGYFDESLLRNQDIQLLARFTFNFKLKEVDKFLHCVDVSDSQNRAVDEKRLIEIRKNLYVSVQDILDTLSKSDMQIINSMRDLEISYILIGHGQYLKSIKYFLSIFKTPATLAHAIKLIKRKISLKII